MKKLFVFMGALALVAGAFGIKGNCAERANALTSGEVDDLKAMMNKYIDDYGQYTKKSHIYLKTSTPDFATYFHAGHTVQERTTYYDDDVLLMGDIDGGFSTINSGYANSGANMVHFRSEDGVNAINSAAVRTPDYTVENKQMSDYFFNLHDLVNAIAEGDWGKYEDPDTHHVTYYHEINNLERVNGEYNDVLLKKFQYFAAPMLLQTAEHYLTFRSIVIDEMGGYLHISIYLADVDSGKVDHADCLLAEAMVYAGLMKPGYYLVGNYGGDYDWQPCSGMQLNKPASGSDHAQLLNATVQALEYQICLLNNNGFTEWFNNVPQINNYAFAEISNGNIHIKYGGIYSFYLNEHDEIYISRIDHKTATFTFTFVSSDWSAWSPVSKFSLHVTTTQNGEIGTWGGADERMVQNGNVYTLSINFNGSVNGLWFYFYEFKDDKDNEKKTNNFLGSFVVEDNGSYTITCAGNSLGWTDGIITSGVSIS